MWHTIGVVSQSRLKAGKQLLIVQNMHCKSTCREAKTFLPVADQQLRGISVALYQDYAQYLKIVWCINAK